jgi:hypothetical protein
MKLQQRKISILILIALFGTMGVGSLSLISVGRAAESEPKDDIYCLTIYDLYEIMAQFDFEGGDDLSPSTYMDLLEAIVEEGSGPHASPNSIDITDYNANQGDTNTTVTITVEGTIGDCDSVFSQIYLSDNNDDGVALAYDDSGFRYTDLETDTTTTAEGDVSGDTLTIEYPNTVYDYNEDGDFMGIMMCMSGNPENPETIEACFDFFPNSLTDDLDPGFYDGGEPITEFIDDIANFLLPWLCRGGAFIIFLSLIALVGKVLIDRQKLYLRIPGGVILGFLFYPEIFYLLDLELMESGIMITTMVLSIMDLIAIISLMLFQAFQFMNNFNLIDDNAWSIFLPAALLLVEGILFITPFFGCVYAVHTIITVVIWIIILTGALYITEFYSKGRLK